MLELFYSGERLFMGLITISALVMLVLSGLGLRAILTNQTEDHVHSKIRWIREVGLFALIMGLLASTLDLVAAFSAIEAAGDVSMSLLAAGLKLTLITTVYGLIIYGLSFLISISLSWKVTRMVA